MIWKYRITCRQLTPEVERIIAAIRVLDHQLTGSKDGEIHLLESREITMRKALTESVSYIPPGRSMNPS